MINLNKLAKTIVLNEGLKKNLSIAQVKEVMRLLFKELKKMTLEDINGIFKKYK